MNIFLFAKKAPSSVKSHPSSAPLHLLILFFSLKKPHLALRGFLPKAACFEEQCREVVQLGILPKAAFLEGQCRESRGGGKLRPVSGGRPVHVFAEGCGR